MMLRTPRTISFALALAVASVALMPDTAFGGEHQYGSWMDFDASAGYAVPIQVVYQFPAAQVYQVGVHVPVVPNVPLFVQIGEHHVLNR
jgi:hypothetical protein